MDSQRRSFLKKGTGLLGLLGLGTYSFAKTKTMKDSSVNFYHVVYFWLKDPSEANKKTFLSHVKEYTGSIDVIKERFIGTPADTNRPVIDNTYTFSIVLAFDSKKDQDAYQEHPVHLAFVEKAQHMWSKVQVYDSVKV
ncbi:conserved hypothetical protein [Imperialibacter sp. EC-SDR9]|nr:Secreted protein [Imperialibacter sp. 89]VVT05053.1 conserved hypothetical protein [Imperialibacter sp. EC-SDR9]